MVCLEVARSAGASRLAAADVLPERREAARRLGAEVGEALVGEFDVVVDAVGTPRARAAAMDHLIGGGTAIWMGLASADPGIDAQALVRAEKRVVGSFAYSDAEFVKAISLVQRFESPWAQTFSLSHESAVIFTELMNGRALPIKALLRP